MIMNCSVLDLRAERKVGGPEFGPPSFWQESMEDSEEVGEGQRVGLVVVP